MSAEAVAMWLAIRQSFFSASAHDVLIVVMVVVSGVFVFRLALRLFGRISGGGD